MNVPASMGVIGGGRMGAGIAHAFALAGSAVVVVERDPVAAGRAQDSVRQSLNRSAEKGVIAAGSVSTATSMDALESCTLVIEAVFEERDAKIAALRAAEAAVAPGATIASNTSSISIDDLATALSGPERFLGLHFFNPVPASSLVEIVMGSSTAANLEQTARAWVSALGKTPIVVRDSPGFASSRLGVALALEAIRMVEQGVALPEDIDLAMERGYRHPVGPLRTTDIVGLDVRLGIAEELHARLGERFAPPELLRRKVAEGRLGRKTGQGFYEWSDK